MLLYLFFCCCFQISQWYELVIFTASMEVWASGGCGYFIVVGVAVYMVDVPIIIYIYIYGSLPPQ